MEGILHVISVLIAAIKNIPGDLASELRSLNPEKFFAFLKEKMHYDISMIDCANYEQQFKDLIIKLTSSARNWFLLSFSLSLEPVVEKFVQKLEQEASSSFYPVEKELETKDPHIYYTEHIMELVRSLEK